MRRMCKWKEPRLDVYLKGLAGRDEAKNVVEDRFVAEALRMQGYNSRIQPASLVDLQQVWTAFENFDAKNDTDIDLNDKYLSEGIKLARKEFGGRRGELLRPLDLYEVIENMKLNTSAGLTAMGCKKVETIEYALTRAEQILRREKKPRPCLAGIRTQQKDDGKNYKNLQEVKLFYKGKTRLVWMYPFEMTIIEGMFAIALIDMFKKRKTPMTIGVRKGILGGRIHNEVETRKYIYALDYSKFDSTICSKFIKCAFRILKTNFGQFDDVQKEAWSRVVNYFLETTIVMPDGYLYVGKKHGVPSGSFFTQLIDSVVNCILVGALSARFGLSLNRRYFMVLGDDLLLSTMKKLPLKQIELFLAKYGIIAHEDKCSTKTHYLGAYWRNGIPTRPLKEVLSKMRFPENYRKYSEDPRVRASQVHLIKVAYSSCYWNLPEKLIYKGLEPTHVDGATPKQYGVTLSVDEMEEVTDMLPGYMKYKNDYEDKVDFGRDFAIVQFS